MGLYLIPTRPPCFIFCRLARSFADNNVAECEYDGGDCCSCDCTDVRATASVNIVGRRDLLLYVELSFGGRCRWHSRCIHGTCCTICHTHTATSQPADSVVFPAWQSLSSTRLLLLLGRLLSRVIIPAAVPASSASTWTRRATVGTAPQQRPQRSE